MSLYDKLWAEQKGRCWLCGGGMRPMGTNHPQAASKDHVKPKSKGGYDKWRNYRLAHRACNSLRGNAPAELYQ